MGSDDRSGFSKFSQNVWKQDIKHSSSVRRLDKINTLGLYWFVSISRLRPVPQQLLRFHYNSMVTSILSQATSGSTSSISLSSTSNLQVFFEHKASSGFNKYSFIHNIFRLHQNTKLRWEGKSNYLSTSVQRGIYNEVHKLFGTELLQKIEELEW